MYSFGQKTRCSIIILTALFTVNLTLLFVETSLADDQGLEADKCAGAFFVLTSISEREPDLGNYFQDQQGLSLEVAIAKRIKVFRELYGLKITKEDVDLFKERGIYFVDEFHTNHPNYIPQFVSDCLAWNVEIFKYLKGREVFDVASNADFPKHRQMAPYPHSNLEDLEPFIHEAFDIWIQNGKPTPQKLKDLFANKSEQKFDPYAGYDFSPNKRDWSPLEEAEMDCGNAHFRMPGEPWPEDLKNNKDLVNYIKRYSTVNLGFEEKTKEYADCVLSLADHYEPSQRSANQKLMNAVVECVEIGLTFNTPKYGRCVLKLINTNSN